MPSAWPTCYGVSVSILRFNPCALSLACLVWGADAQAQEERRVQDADVVFVWCDEGQGTVSQGTSYEVLEVDARVYLHLPGGKTIVVRGLTATDILERWRGRLCREGSMARAVSIVRRGDDIAAWARAHPVVDAELDQLMQESERKRKEVDWLLWDLRRRTVEAKNLEAISNGSLVLPTPPVAPGPKTNAR